MIGRAAAYAVLGLQPDADAAAIHSAYRRLIKQFHPDREGGDGVRAAEIIHAYRELRGGRAVAEIQFNGVIPRRKHRRWPFTLGVASVATTMGFLIASFGPPLVVAAPGSQPRLWFKHRKHEVMEEPLNLRAIGSGVAQATKLYMTRNEIALAEVSNSCHRRFRNNPGTDQLDRCAAFDNAIIALEDRDPLRNRGPFSPLAVTGRQWRAASTLSNNYLAIDSRLDRIRLRVELMLVRKTNPGREGEGAS